MARRQHQLLTLIWAVRDRQSPTASTAEESETRPAGARCSSWCRGRKRQAALAAGNAVRIHWHKCTPSDFPSHAVAMEGTKMTQTNGNCAVNALVDAQARVVWCCMPRPDADPIFHALLDSAQGAEVTGQGRAFRLRLVPCEGDVPEHEVAFAGCTTRMGRNRRTYS